MSEYDTECDNCGDPLNAGDSYDSDDGLLCYACYSDMSCPRCGAMLEDDECPDFTCFSNMD